MPAATAYWARCSTSFIYSFGWARPDRGILWWWWAGEPTDDPRFQLLSNAWEADGMLDWFHTGSTPHPSTLFSKRVIHGRRQRGWTRSRTVWDLQRAVEAASQSAARPGLWEARRASFLVEGRLSASELVLVDTGQPG